ncbi:hypothetical protein BP6252_01616 [Coleophoma cylindrospora]|uniref:Uncharacterized protein n=1 Tax=Coleophoma cylindrospora TaxID=1849047 RepID=A0A3D8STK5_9HELO|nr:hypothetical protein BP6252_01616 [Coleophoma cylindrospora]
MSVVGDMKRWAQPKSSSAPVRDGLSLGEGQEASWQGGRQWQQRCSGAEETEMALAQLRRPRWETNDP